MMPAIHALGTGFEGERVRLVGLIDPIPGKVVEQVGGDGAERIGVAVDPVTRRVQVPGERADVRERSTTVALHLLRRALLAQE